jgi:hypothetical protein
VTDELAERVERGAALLDERRPGWWDEVDVGSLDLRQCDLCILGQLWGDYLDGRGEVVRLGYGYRAQEESIRHGFDVSRRIHADLHADYAALTDLWRAAIERRRAAERTAP